MSSEPPKLPDNLYFLRWTFYADGTVVKSGTPHRTPTIEHRKPPEEQVAEPPAKIPVRLLICKRCGYEWKSRKKRMPKQCPKCKSPYWNRQRKYGK